MKDKFDLLGNQYDRLAADHVWLKHQYETLERNYTLILRHKVDIALTKDYN